MQVNAQDEHIPGKGEGRVAGQAEEPDVPDRLERDGTFGGFGKAGEHVAEDAFIRSQTHFDSFAVKGTEAAQVA